MTGPPPCNKLTGFDFFPSLKTHYPNAFYLTGPLSDGLVNHTVRARLTACRSMDDPSVPKSIPSLIVKHAPPYIATIGPRAPFPTERQTVEATVLGLLSSSTSSLAHLAASANVRVPRVLVHDKLVSVLMLEDLGELGTLWDFFEPSTLRELVSKVGKEKVLERAAEVGRRVGAFFAGVHSTETLKRIKDLGAERDVLEQRLTDEVVRDAAVKPIFKRLQDQGGMDEDSAGRLYARVNGDFERGALEGEVCFSMGDFHPGSVLVSGGADEELVVGVIDWEFATINEGRGVNGDMAQFLAAVHVLLLSLPREGQNAVVKEAVEGFVGEMCRAYSEGSDLVKRVSSALGPARTTDDSAMGIFRSALILFGRETINQAVERPWDNGSGVSFKDMVTAGAWYLERAGDSVEEMLEDENWEKLMTEESKIILQLFCLGQQQILAN